MYKNSIKMSYMLEMDNKHRYEGHTVEWHVYDIIPSQYHYYQGRRVDMVNYVCDNSDDGVTYEPVFPAGDPFLAIFEPFDKTVPDQSSELRNTGDYATDSRYKSEAKRLQAFHDTCLEDYNVKPEDLARDGFIHIGPGDEVRCVFCFITLRNWEADDSVEVCHRKHSLFCPFIRGEYHGVNIPLNEREIMKQSFWYNSEANRLQTFRNRWLKDYNVKPEDLARDGFIHIGPGDKVKCVFCLKTFGYNWVVDDSVEIEYTKHYPFCPFVRGECHGINIPLNEREIMKQSFWYNSEANRLQTFCDRWLKDYKVKPEDLARDGFIHVGHGDKVKCVFCLKTLRNWKAGDSVEVCHRKRNSSCQFVRGECHGVNIPLNARENMKQSFGITVKPAGQTAVPNCKIFLNVYNHLRSGQNKHT